MEALANMSQELQQTLRCIFSEQISLIDTLMTKIDLISKLLKSELIYPEEWNIKELKLNEFDSYEQCLENFSVCFLILN